MNPVDAGLPAGVTESVEVPRRADAVRNREKVIAAAEQVFGKQDAADQRHREVLALDVGKRVADDVQEVPVG